MFILAHYSRTLGHGIDWNTCEGAIYHASYCGTSTLCGYRADAPGLNQGASNRGWDLKGGGTKRDVDCQRCLRLLAHQEN